METYEDYDSVLERARALGEERHPDAPAEHHGAFANSVACLVTGWSGGYGRPSMREHYACRQGVGGEYSFEEAVAIAEPICYGPLTPKIAMMAVEDPCFDDAPGEFREAIRLLGSREE